MVERTSDKRHAPLEAAPDWSAPDLPPLQLPHIHARREHDDGRYQVEELDLEFSNAERRNYQRLQARGRGAVMIAALPDAEHILLVREYACGMHRYELGLPKGRMDSGETPIEAANRELMEEVGFGARELRVLRKLSMAPTFMNHEIHLVLARDLYPERLPGDEPEPLEVVPWRLDCLHLLTLREDCSEGRSLAAMFVVRELLRYGGL
ncbi:MAG: ADP compounds hydrolase NudE [Lysobacteraceae bacterium]